MLHARMLMYLDEVVRSGSIRKAAMKLNVASTAINRQIIALEEELGQPIFERMPRRLRLTATGEALIE
ncbi:LysR family transcriptional regulator, partial [Rhizobium pusense]|nr:LysR family transcriptional regulator [Agrobacterium pusense]MDH1098540.1 LysR family transcriptional regulator [Agrobacterium pusense]MDH1115078.1 LysR family transcriptional regulator [Agrobacterium pusense]MDH2196840.1 LysR family transcriptional regulator [Agrobacterium pusense]